VLHQAAVAPQPSRARPQPSAGKAKYSAHSARRHAGQRRHQSSDVPGVVGRYLAATRRMSRPVVSSPTLRLSRLTFSIAQRVFLCAPHAMRSPRRVETAAATPLPWLLSPVTPRRVSCRRVSLQKVQHQRGATLGRPVPGTAVCLPFAISSGLLALYFYWWFIYGPLPYATPTAQAECDDPVAVIYSACLVGRYLRAPGLDGNPRTFALSNSRPRWGLSHTPGSRKCRSDRFAISITLQCAQPTVGQPCTYGFLRA
jgi:hypothetical protein